MPNKPYSIPNASVERVMAAFKARYHKESLSQILSTFEQADIEKYLATLSDEEQRFLEFDWKFWSRPNQRAPEGNWKRWILNCGRGFGKTRTGAEWVRDQIESGRCRHMALIAENAKDIRRVIVEDVRGGGSGIMQVCPPWNLPHYSPTTMRLTWTNPNYPSYGASCSLYSAEEPGALRGPAHD